MVEEYDVTFALKEWLLDHGWDIVAFNPPGSQGTFTIPNPSKDQKYRGQTGSEAPDIIAVKHGKHLLLVECKPKYNEKDTKKLLNLCENRERVNLLIALLSKSCEANNIEFKPPVKLILAKAHGGEQKVRMDMLTFMISTDNSWNPLKIDPKIDPYKYMDVVFLESNKAIGDLVTK